MYKTTQIVSEEIVAHIDNNIMLNSNGNKCKYLFGIKIYDHSWHNTIVDIRQKKSNRVE